MKIPSAECAKRFKETERDRLKSTLLGSRPGQLMIGPGLGLSI